MYNLLIVDDEIEALDYLVDICREITSHELYIYRASSGEEALEIIREVRLDVLLSDIRMPGISGLELIQLARKETNHCKFILLTGYRNFDTVYQAIQNGDVRYLLKTESENVIRQAVMEAIEELRSEIDKREILRRAQIHLTQALPLLQHEYLADILTHSAQSSLCQKQLDELDIHLYAKRPLLLAVGRFDNLSPNQKSHMQALLSELFKENIPPEICFYLISKSIYTACIFQSNAQASSLELSLHQLQNLLEYIQTTLYKIEHISISFAFGTQLLPWEQLSQRYDSLCRALLLQGGQSTSVLIAIGEESPELNKCLISASNRQKYEQLREHLEAHRQAQYFGLLREVLSCFYIQDDTNPYVLEEIYYSIAVMLLNFINSNALASQLDTDHNLYQLLQSKSHASWPEAATFLSDLSASLFERIGSLQKSRTKKVLDIVTDYISENLQSDLTLSTLADLVHFNQSYFSRLFKREMNGVNLSEYILSQRMERAKYLLVSTSLQIQEIAPLVGYQSSHSFSRLFRSITGLSPQDYRAMHLQFSSPAHIESNNK